MRRLVFGLAIASIAVLSPCWVRADDQHIAQQIVQQLQEQKADGKLSGFGIDLEVESGIVWLKGHVRSTEQQSLVLDIARRVSGVEQVVNDLQIKNVAAADSPKPRVQTALLKTETSNKLFKAPGELLTNLRGNVQRAFRPDSDTVPQPKAAAQEPTPAPAPKKPQIASQEPTPAPAPERQQPSPRVHTASIAQAQPTAPTDEQLAEAIIDRLRAQKDRGTLQNFDIDVQVNDRVVWVSGRVASDTQRNLVLDISRRMRGVKQVVNDLQVDAPTAVQVVSVPVPIPTATQEPASVMQAPAAPTAGSPAPAPFHYVPAQPTTTASQMPLAFAPAQSVAYAQQMAGQPIAEVPAAAGVARARFDHPVMPGYAWPSYAAYPNYAAVTYPAAVLADRLAVHRPVLSLSAGAAWAGGR